MKSAPRQPEPGGAAAPQHPTRQWLRTALAVVVVALGSGCTLARAGEGAPGKPAHPSRSLADTCAAAAPAVASHFDLRSSFWLNLHNFLFQEAKRARGLRDEARSALADPALEAPPARPLDPEEQGSWRQAVAYYAEVILAGQQHPDSVVIRVNNRLALSDSVPEIGAALFDGRLREVLLAAAPVYRAIWWPGHDARNRAWIAAMREYLELYEPCLAPRLAAQLGGRWPDHPIRVDATVYASWFGAYTTFAPPHITISTTAAGSQGASGLESLLHEAGHVMLAPLEAAIRSAAARQEVAADPDLGHLLLFYTAGDLVWRAIPDHPTNAVRFGVWSRNRRAELIRQTLAREWRPWLDGERTMQDALHALLRARAVAAGG